MITIENHLGKITISEKFLTDLIRHAVCDCFGVSDVCNVNTFRSAVSSITGGKLFKRKGVLVRTSDNGDLYIDLHIKVSYGTNISAAVDSISHKVAFTVEETVGISVKEVNVYVDDMNY